MPVLRTIKSDYEFYHDQKSDQFVALDSANRKLLSDYWKANKGKQKTTAPKLMIPGYKLVMDEEFQSLKIDFTEVFQSEAKDLEKTKLLDL
ncbi:MAG TPA: hypothetical protein PKH79_00705 [Prolixibacteraceae bacterium]|nr:hypothetical protein [Prolixibacteraceae bacterium]HPS11828.1 hypothetical protein [Prolixibacteraceae bacterium]